MTTFLKKSRKRRTSVTTRQTLQARVELLTQGRWSGCRTAGRASRTHAGRTAGRHPIRVGLARNTSRIQGQRGPVPLAEFARFAESRRSGRPHYASRAEFASSQSSQSRVVRAARIREVRRVASSGPSASGSSFSENALAFGSRCGGFKLLSPTELDSSRRLGEQLLAPVAQRGHRRCDARRPVALLRSQPDGRRRRLAQHLRQNLLVARCAHVGTEPESRHIAAETSGELSERGDARDAIRAIRRRERQNLVHPASQLGDDTVRLLDVVQRSVGWRRSQSAAGR